MNFSLATLLRGIVFLALLYPTKGQYETANNLCGGYFRSNRGSINFKFASDSAGQTDKICIWTIIPPVPFEYSAYRMNVTAFNYPGATVSVVVNGFKERVSEPQKVAIGGVTANFNVDGPLVVIVLKVNTATLNHGMDIFWQEAGEQLNVSRITNTYHSWSQSSVQPLPYFAAGFMRNEISTFAFPKGNSTTGYVLQLIFDTIRLDCGCTTLPTVPAQRIGCDFIAMCAIDDTGSLIQRVLYHNNSTSLPAQSNKNGFYLIVWSSDEPRGGGNFQMRYNTVRG